MRGISFRRLLIIAAIGFFTVFAAVFLYLRSQFNAQFLAAQISRLTGAACSIDEISLSLRGLTLTRVNLSSPQTDSPFCAFEQVRLTFDRDTWRNLWHDRRVNFLTLAVDGVFFNVDRFQSFEQGLHAAAAVAPDAPLEKKSPIAIDWGLDHFIFRNLRVVIRDRELLFSEASGDWRDGKMPFVATGAVGDGKITATGDAEFSVIDRILRILQVETVLQVESFPIDWLTDSFPDAFDFMQPRGVMSGKIELACDWREVGDFIFMGQIKVDDAGVHLFGEDIPLPLSDGEFSGTFSYAADCLTLDKLVIKGDRDDFSMDGFADHAAEKMMFRVESAGLSWRIVCALAGNPRLAEQADGLVNFNGTVALKGDELEIYGEGGSEELTPRFPALSPFGKLRAKSAIAYNSRERIVRLRDLAFGSALGNVAGSLRFPYFTALTADNFAGDLTFASDLAKIGDWLGIAIRGSLIGKISANVTGGAAADASDAVGIKCHVELKSLEKVSVGDGARNFDFGRISVLGRGDYVANKLRVEQLQISALPLAAAFRGEYAEAQAAFTYSVRLRPREWLHLLNLPAQFTPERFGEIRAQGYATATARELTLQKAAIRGALLSGEKVAWNYAVSGDAKISPRGFAIQNGAAFLAQNTATLLTVNFAGETGERPPRWDLSLRGKTRAAAQMAAYFGYAQLPLWDGETQLAMQITPETAARQSDELLETGASRGWRAELAGEFADAPLFAWLRPQKISYAAKIAANSEQLAWKELKITAAGISATATGTWRADKFALDARVDIDCERAAAELKNPPVWRLRGNLPLSVKLSGSPAHPEFSLNAAPPEIAWISANAARRLTAPKLTLAGNFARDADGVRSVKITRGALETPDFLLQIAAQAERLAFTPEAINFGKGAAGSFTLRGKRAALIWLIPALQPYCGGTKNFPDTEKSLGISGIARAAKIPLTAEPSRDDWQIDDGKFFIDSVRFGAIAVRQILLPYQYRGRQLTVNNGVGDAGGKISVNLAANFTGAAPRGFIETRANELEISRWFGELSATQKITGGRLTFPVAAPLAEAFVRAEWRGATFDEIIASLATEEFTLQIDDLTIVAPRQRIDWLQLLETDFHPTVARELAKILDQHTNREVGKPQTFAIRQAQLKSKIKDQSWLIAPAVIEGKNIADLSAAGRFFFDRRLQMRVLIRDNLARQFDFSELQAQPQVRDFIASLPPAQRREALEIFPNWLNALARSRKLYFDIGGEIGALRVDLLPLQKAVRAELPSLLSRLVDMASGSAAVKNFLSKELNLSPSPAPNAPLIDLDRLLK